MTTPQPPGPYDHPPFPPQPGQQPPKKSRQGLIIAGVIGGGLVAMCLVLGIIGAVTSKGKKPAASSSKAPITVQSVAPSPTVEPDGGTFTDPKALADAVDTRSTMACGTYTAGTSGNWPSGSCDTLAALLVVMSDGTDPATIAPQLAGTSAVQILRGRNWLIAFTGGDAAGKAAIVKAGLGGTVVTVPAKPPAVKPKPKTPTIPGEGTFIPGTDFPAGTYRTAGGDSCYWARLRDLDGGVNSIIANNNVTGPTVVRIRATDKGFETSGCGDWTKIG